MGDDLEKRILEKPVPPWDAKYTFRQGKTAHIQLQLSEPFVYKAQHPELDVTGHGVTVDAALQELCEKIWALYCAYRDDYRAALSQTQPKRKRKGMKKEQPLSPEGEELKKKYEHYSEYIEEIPSAQVGEQGPAKSPGKKENGKEKKQIPPTSLGPFGYGSPS